MEKHFVPAVSKISAQRHPVAIRDSFIASMPLMILGALAVMINNSPTPDFQELMNSIFGSESWKGFGAAAWSDTFAILSVLTTFLLAYHSANGHRKDGVSAGTISLGSLFALGGALGMSLNGLFVAIIVGVTSAEIFVRLSGNERLIIRMSDGVPPAATKVSAPLLPATITASAFVSVAAVFATFGVGDIVGPFYTVVQEPFMGLANSYPSALLLAFIAPFLWFFGLHGANMINSLIRTINVPAIEASVSAIAARRNTPFIMNKPFFNSFVNLGGAGATLGLSSAIYPVGRKNKLYMVVTNLLITLGVFNINELAMSDLPIVLDPITSIPFVLTPMALVSIVYFATSTGLMPAAIAMPSQVTPLIIGGVLAAKSIAGGVLAVVDLIFSILIYLPFVKAATIQERRREALGAQ